MIYAPAATFIQTYMRTGDMATAMAKRLLAKQAVVEGVQFALRRTMGIEGDGEFRVGIIRGSTKANARMTLRVGAVSGTAVEGRDFRIVEPTVELAPGERYTSARIELLDNGVSLSTSDQTWLPVRDFVLTIACDDADQLGATRTDLVAELAWWSCCQPG